MKVKLILMVLLLPMMVSGEDVIYLKSDSTWAASESVLQQDWFKVPYELSGWGYAVSGWKNNPCSDYCGKIKSCDVSCQDWMWYGDSCDNCTRFFRKIVDVPGEIKSASITISGDDFYWLYINSNFVGVDERKQGYANAETYDISSFLHEGENVVAIKVEDRQDYEGVVISGKIEYTNVRQIINQYTAQVETLESQVSALTQDKDTLQQRTDSLESQLQAKVQENENLKKTSEELRRLSQSLSVDLAKYKRANKILNVVLIILFIAIVVVGNHVYKKYIQKRKPTLSSVPLKKEIRKESY